ncbi:GNAT family N-acetyltransferase [Corynebacterium sp. UBA2622]|uniref:GNAT family N-acetyltransferase n=1 Tax=Corynebacterium sp. UBA2622 TaxID=1946393 RepID=UPI0025B9E760|nr:N-acetyltransferase [Corynebacterium sp. UBA2622]
MTVSIRRLTGHEFSLLAPTLVDIYITAMDYPRSIRKQRIDIWRREIVCPGFTAVIAVEGAGTDERVVGVAYGFLGTRGRWWDQQLIRGLKQSGSLTPEVSAMVDDYFEIAEIHVDSLMQGRGIGRDLLTELVRTTSASWALLSTPEVAGENNPAFGLYRKLGFSDILRHYTYSGDRRPFAVLGRRLPLDLPG